MKEVKVLNTNQHYFTAKIVCVGRNYVKHAEELGNEVPKSPILFTKPTSSVIYSGEKIIIPGWTEDVHHEVELVLLMGRTIKDADDATAEEAIAGYAVGLDMTARDIQQQLKDKGHPWDVSKGFDTSCVLGDFVFKSDVQLSGNEKIWLNVNGEERQNSTLDMMIHSSTLLVKYISSKMTLEKGDLIMTGTPEGVSKVNKGDKITAGIEKLPEIAVEVV